VTRCFQLGVVHELVVLPVGKGTFKALGNTLAPFRAQTV